jgi:Concanavalin A-like lectin/glucanases superfamily/Domain of unknown function (DUF2341)
MRALFLSAVATSFALLCLCSGPQRIAGGTSSSENARVTGIITDTAGIPAAGARVLLIPSAFDPSREVLSQSAFGDTTRANGAYAFDGIAPGTYNIEAADPVHGTSLLITGIAVVKKDSLSMAPDTLRKPGTVIIGVAAGDSAGGSVVITGTTRFRNLAAFAQSVTLDSVPHGTIPSIVLEPSGGTTPVLLGKNVRIVPSDTVYISKSAKILINTSSTGAGVSGTVTHFPVFVRLDSTFAFGQARSDGGDIRFAKPDGTPLKYEISQWDTAAKQAALWVSVDTVYPNSATQYITMSWGFPGSQNASNSTAVFDTAFGFAGVWHLDDTATAFGTANSFKDATFKRAYGANFITAVDRTGIDGPGHDFNGSDYILVSRNILSMASSDFTIALWADIRRERCNIFSKDTAIAQDSCARRLYCGDADGDSSGLHPSFGGKGCGAAVSSTALTLNEWHHIVFTWISATKTGSFFVDGVQTGLASNNLTAGCPDNPRDRIVFGYDNQLLFGYLDEIHISDTARSSDWIKLSYESQRAGQTLVTIVQQQ